MSIFHSVKTKGKIYPSNNKNYLNMLFYNYGVNYLVIAFMKMNQVRLNCVNFGSREFCW